MNTRRRLAVSAGLAMLTLVLPGAAAPRAEAPAAATSVRWQRHPVTASELPAFAGVKLVLVAVSGGGGLLDLRYQVTDAGKATSTHADATPPAIVDEATGLVISQLYMNHAHSGPMKPAVTYYLVFENPGGWIRRGSAVTVLLGDAQVEHVVVR